MRSDPSGSSWDTPRNVTSTAKDASWSWYATGPGAGIQLQSGRLVAPCDHAEQRRGLSAVLASALRGLGRFGYFGYSSHLLLSDDGGETWEIGGRGDVNTNECAVVELPSGAQSVLESLSWQRKLRPSSDLITQLYDTPPKKAQLIRPETAALAEYIRDLHML